MYCGRPSRPWRRVAFPPAIGASKSKSTRAAWQAIDPAAPEPDGSSLRPNLAERRKSMNAITPTSSRGRTWFQALADKAQPVDTGLGERARRRRQRWARRACGLARDRAGPAGIAFPEARHGRTRASKRDGRLARHVREAIARRPFRRKAADHRRRRRPEPGLRALEAALLGIHLSLAAAADAYAAARMAGHPVVALIVGTALSGGLARRTAIRRAACWRLDDPKVIIQAMRRQSARVTRRTVEELDELGKTVHPA